ncbi:hypothetical protein ACFQHW_08250 [Lapidilactobacillus achengensis]|uniref:Uncharacterized protein n=1 Tax=Lapidilactobacillus achengensis TaxID=2486000 RepID=A0ABW1UNP6_9LACO|nr:hypothetical protein [Lapidilactobacillus achengensis]
MADDEFFEIDEIMATLLQTASFDVKYGPMRIGWMYESIRDTMAEM